jgi:hypothetical protein
MKILLNLKKLRTMHYTINFVDLFDWEKESDLHYFQLINGYEEHLYEQKPAKVIVKHKKNDNKVNKRALARARKKGLHP